MLKGYMWGFILIGFAAIALAGAVYLTFRFHKISFIRKIEEKSRALSWLAAFAPVALCAVFFVFNIYTVVIVLVHLVLASLLVDLIVFLISKFSGKKIAYDLKCCIALGMTALYIGVGFFCAYHVFRTDYTVKTDKSSVDGLRIVLFADSHIGVTLDGERLEEQVGRMNEEHADVVVITGDFVDDDSTKDEMIAACAALGKLKTTYGVYYVFGNHDKGYFRYRDYTGQELRDELQKNGVTVLEDESVLIDDRFYIVGRKDRSVKERKSAEELTAGLDPSKYIILLDHQPNDYDNESKTAADLVLSGHTHGGHIFPAGLIGEWSGINDRTYGVETREGTTFVVTSGISGWALPVKTGTASEYVVIDVKNV